MLPARDSSGQAVSLGTATVTHPTGTITVLAQPLVVHEFENHMRTAATVSPPSVELGDAPQSFGEHPCH